MYDFLGVIGCHSASVYQTLSKSTIYSGVMIDVKSIFQKRLNVATDQGIRVRV